MKQDLPFRDTSKRKAAYVSVGNVERVVLPT